MAQHNVSLSVNAGTDTFSLVQTISDAQSRAVDVTLAASTTNQEVDLVLTNADVDSLVITAVGGDCTIKTNSTSAPGNTVVLAAGQMTYFAAGGSAGGTGLTAFGTNPFAAANVTKLYLSSTAGCTFKLRAVVNASNG